MHVSAPAPRTWRPLTAQLPGMRVPSQLPPVQQIPPFAAFGPLPMLNMTLRTPTPNPSPTCPSAARLEHVRRVPLRHPQRQLRAAPEHRQVWECGF